MEKSIFLSFVWNSILQSRIYPCKVDFTFSIHPVVINRPGLSPFAPFQRFSKCLFKNSRPYSSPMLSSTVRLFHSHETVME